VYALPGIGMILLSKLPNGELAVIWCANVDEGK